MRYLWELGGIGTGYIPKVKKWIKYLQPFFLPKAFQSLMNKLMYADLLETLLLNMDVKYN